MVEFGVLGDLIPWKAPKIGGRHTYKCPKLKEWQRVIAHAADAAYEGEPHDGPVELVVVFVKHHKDRRKWGTWWGKRPDLDNLQKALADAIDGQALRKGRSDPPSEVGRVIKDDNQVVKTEVWKLFGPKSGFWLTVNRLGTERIELPKFFEDN